MVNLNMKEDKLKKKIAEFKRQQPYVVHPANILFEDGEKLYWTFVFHPEIVYLQDGDDKWVHFQGEVSELLECFDLSDDPQKYFY